MTTEEYTAEVTRVFEEFLGRVQQLSTVELEDDVLRMLGHIASNNYMAHACVTMLPLHSYLLYRTANTGVDARWFGDFLELVLAEIEDADTEDKFGLSADTVTNRQYGKELMILCAAALLRYNANNPLEEMKETQ